MYIFLKELPEFSRIRW